MNIERFGKGYVFITAKKKDKELVWLYTTKKFAYEILSLKLKDKFADSLSRVEAKEFMKFDSVKDRDKYISAKKLELIARGV